MRDAVAAAALAGALLCAPAQATAPQATMSGSVAAMNRAGFAEFAAAGSGRTDVLVSPLLDWYVRTFLSLHSPDAPARNLVAQLRRNRVIVDATVHAARGRSGYTDKIASYAHDDLGATTLWDQRAGADYAWTAEVDIRTSDDIGDKRSPEFDDEPLQARFYARDGIRAVRLDASDGSRALFAFFGTRAAVSDLRKRMSADLWRQLTSGFVSSDVVLSHFALHQRRGVSIPTPARDGFAFSDVSEVSLDGEGDVWMSASVQQVSSRLHAAVRGYPTVYQPGEPRPAYRIVHADPTYRIPDERRISAIVPMLYVLEDAKSGAIIVMGANA